MGGAEAFCGAGDEDEGDVGELLAEGRELGEEVAAYAAGSWGVSDLSEVFLLALEKDKHRYRKSEWTHSICCNMLTHSKAHHFEK